jgi:hypothetical protein
MQNLSDHCPGPNASWYTQTYSLIISGTTVQQCWLTCSDLTAQEPWLILLICTDSCNERDA